MQGIIWLQNIRQLQVCESSSSHLNALQKVLRWSILLCNIIIVQYLKLHSNVDRLGVIFKRLCNILCRLWVVLRNTHSERSELPSNKQQNDWCRERLT